MIMVGRGGYLDMNKDGKIFLIFLVRVVNILYVNYFILK